MNTQKEDSGLGAAPQTADSRAAGTGRLGMVIFLISLSMLFGASIVGYLVVRLRAESWRVAGMPPLPSGLWLSTVILVAGSGVIHFALAKMRMNQPVAARRALVAGFILGVAFLLNQTLNWVSLAAAQLPPTSRSLYAFTFYMLTGLHAVHIVGGLVQLGVVTSRTIRAVYTPAYHPGITYAVMYWHFLDAVWLVMFFVMLALT